MHPDITRILHNGTHPLTPDAAARLVELLPAHRLDIYAAARLAASAASKDIFSCGIINAKSGRCAEDCSFCAQSAHHSAGAKVYGLVSVEKLLERAQQLADNGARYMGIVISGTAPTSKDFDALCEAAPVILSRVPIALCASLGLLDYSSALTLRQAGYASYHHNLETARSWYGRVCTTHAYERRLETVNNALRAGLRVCSGGIFGMGEGWPERLELSATLQDLGGHSIPINFLTPVKGTPMEGQTRLRVQEALDIVAVYRLMHPGKDLIICGGRAATLGDWENTLFFTGANALMIGDYLTTKGSDAGRDTRMLAMFRGSATPYKRGCKEKS